MPESRNLARQLRLPLSELVRFRFCRSLPMSSTISVNSSPILGHVNPRPSAFVDNSTQFRSWKADQSADLHNDNLSLNYPLPNARLSDAQFVSEFFDGEEPVPALARALASVTFGLSHRWPWRWDRTRPAWRVGVAYLRVSVPGRQSLAGKRR